MKQKFHFIAKGFILIMLTVFFQSFAKKPGGDYYRIFLNEKLVKEQFLTQVNSLTTLALNSTNLKDHLTIHFSHCGTAGKGRTIMLKDEKGKLVKEWKFADSKSTGMQLPVKEILQVSGITSEGSIYYASKEKPFGQLLTGLNFKRSVVAKL
jgi:hypothetical protein